MGIIVRRKVQAALRRIKPYDRPSVAPLLYRLAYARKWKETGFRDKRIYKFLALYNGTPLPKEICYRIAMQS